MQQSNQITIDLKSGSVLPLVLGKSRTTDFYIKNNSSTDKAYNVSVVVTLADSLELSSSSIQATNVINQEDNSKKYTFINVKDFAPNEINYKMNFTVKSNENYKNLKPVDFNSKLQSSITIIWDSMPRGEYDTSNIQYYNSTSFDFEIIRLSINKTMPLKKVKGAGTDTIAASKIFDCIIEIQNNTREDTTFSITDSFPDSIRYLGNINTILPTQVPLPNPDINVDTQTAKKSIEWNNYSLLKGELLKFSYNAAIWDNYSLNGIENLGVNINHGTNISTEISAINNDFNISEIKKITAMDAIITISDNKTIIDVADIIYYYLKIEVNQYYSIKNVIATFFTPDGQEPLDTTGGTILQEQINYTIPVQYSIANIDKNSFFNINLTTKVVSQYRADMQYVSCGDIFTANATLEADNLYDESIQDNSLCSQSIIIPTISKKIINIYYRNLAVKNNTLAVAPLDWIEYELSFDSSFIKAAKKNILLDDFFPLESRLPDTELIEQISGISVEPELISPHGLRWDLGNVIDETPWKIHLKSQVGSSVSQTSLNNLFKLTGETSANNSYSDRKQIARTTGNPNLTITRTYDGFTPTNVYGGVEYTCRLKISNLQNLEETTTDAFAFQIAEQTYNGITVVPNSWSISGSGYYTQPQGGSNFITAQIIRLYVGQEITLSYKVILPTNIYPAFIGNMACQAGVPYTQIIDALLENVLYSLTPPSSSVQLKTKNININKTYTNSVLKVGSQVDYSLQYIVPKGTAIYNANLIDELPLGQKLKGEVSLNGNPVSVEISNQNIIFPEISIINPKEKDDTFNYTFSTIINDAVISYPTTTQANKGLLSYKNYLDNTFSRSILRNVIISHPLLTVSISAINGTTLDNKTSFNVKINLENKSAVGARECVIQVPFPSNAIYISSYSQVGSISIEGSMLKWNIGSIPGLQNQSLTFSFKGNNNIFVMDKIDFLATLLEYKNDISDTKIYPKTESNNLTYICMPSVNLSVYPANRTLAGTGYFQFTSSSVIDAPYSIVNTSGGKDSFSLKISPIKWPYDLFIDDNFQTRVEALTSYSDAPSLLFQIPSGNERDIRLRIYIPTLTQIDYDRFTITVYSLADNNYYSDVLTLLIDP